MAWTEDKRKRKGDHESIAKVALNSERIKRELIFFIVNKTNMSSLWRRIFIPSGKETKSFSNTGQRVLEADPGIFSGDFLNAWIIKKR